MAKSQKKKAVKPKATEIDKPKEEFIPEVVDEGVVRDEEKMNPMDLVAASDSEKVRTAGNWKKVPQGEIARLEEEGLLVGYDSLTGEVLLKGE